MVETAHAPRRQPLHAKPKKNKAGVVVIPLDPPPVAPAARAEAVVERRPDPVWVHALRYFGIHSLMLVTSWFLGAGLVWAAFAMGVTGRRKRDVVMLFIPVWGAIVMVQTVWRYTSRDVYWSVRDDRPSRPFFDW